MNQVRSQEDALWCIRASPTIWQILFLKSRCLPTPKIIWGVKKISSPTVWQILFQKPPKPANETKRPAKRMKSPVKRTKSPDKHEETTMCSRCRARIYARNRPRFANLPKMPNPDTKLLKKYFSHFVKNFRMPNLYAKLLEML
jgi:hypothetical protein